MPRLSKNVQLHHRMNFPSGIAGKIIDVELEKELQQLAAQNACTHAGQMAAKKRFKLARDVRAVEERIMLS